MSSWITKLNDEDAGKRAILKDSYALNYEVVRIQMIKANFKINKNSSQALLKTQFLDQIYVVLTRSTALSKLNILSNFVPRSINSSNLTLNHYEYLRKKKNLFITTFSQLKLFFALLNERAMLTNISNLMGDSRLEFTTFLFNWNLVIVNNCSYRCILYRWNC